MSFAKEMSDITKIPVKKIPSGYQIIGKIMLLKVPQLTKIEKQKLAKAVLDSYPSVKTVCETKGIGGEYRRPRVKILAGRRKLETIHKEHGISYKLNVGKIMFSAGNLSERKRLIDQVTKDEIIVDMFAGIGYFSLGLGKKSPAKKIYAIEKNKTTFGYLKENIKLNKIENIIPKLGDCRNIKIRPNADRVLMGYLPGTSVFLNSAFRFLGKEGIIHFHNIYRAKQLWAKPLRELEKYANKNDYIVKSIAQKRKIKSYAPKIYHIVVDILVKEN